MKLKDLFKVLNEGDINLYIWETDSMEQYDNETRIKYQDYKVMDIYPSQKENNTMIIEIKENKFEKTNYQTFENKMKKLKQQKDDLQEEINDLADAYEDEVENVKKKIIKIGKEKYGICFSDYSSECLLDEFLNRDINVEEKEIIKAFEEYKIKYKK